MAGRQALVPALAAALWISALSQGSSAQFVVDTAKVPSGTPFNDSTTENVDFGDVDLDGDWDVLMADGGDDGDDQNRIWINQGGLQGGTIGFYNDETAARLPAVLDDSRDIEFADIDNDGDLDSYTANTAQSNPQGNRWWVNKGLLQGGTLGYYADETSSRWVNLGGPGSSIAPSLVIAPGTFVDWSCDCDFGDLDNDGDLDLVHSTYGTAFGGQVPTRLFLNDGTGRFSEFNPSGVQLTLATIPPGTPGLWCDGVQAHNTTDTTGAFCDIAASALDVDVGDIDGDFDLDILHGDREQVPRMFANRLNASSLAPAMGGGALGFRDVTGMVFPPGYSIGDGHYDQALGDMDKDGDLDLVGVNWQTALFNFNDITLRNNGSGIYSSLTVLAGSDSDDNEGDLLDYDNDGDLDLYFANFSGQDKLYRNNTTAPGSFSFTSVGLGASFSAASLDADVADTDKDGDYDVLVAEDNFQANTFLRNVTEVPDTTQPYLPNVETIGNQIAHAAPIAVRVHVYDNASYYTTWYNDTVLHVKVGGISLPPLPARSSMGQVFRGELPGNLVGSVSYNFTSADEYGNTGSSPAKTYTASFAGSFATSYGTGTTGLVGGMPVLAALSVPFVTSKLYLALSSNAPAGTLAIIALGTQSIPPTSLPGLLLLNIGGTPLAVVQSALDASGDFVLGGKIAAGMPLGIHLFAQGFVLDPTGVHALASSKGLDIVVQ